MKCPQCQQNNDPGDIFCIKCGALLREPSSHALGSEAIEAISKQVAQLREETRSLRVIIASANERLAQLERRIVPGQAAASSAGTATPPIIQQSKPATVPTPPQPAVASGAAPNKAAEAVENPRRDLLKGAIPQIAYMDLEEELAAGRPPRSPDSPGQSRAEWVNWERILGGNWLARVGVLAIIIGAIFFFKLAFDRGWIGPLGRVGLVLLSGLVLVGLGQYFHKRYPVFAQTLSGGGIALVYAAAFVAFAVYGLIGFYPATVLLFLISVVGVGIALAYDSMGLAILGVTGALAAPLLLGAFVPGEAVRRSGIQLTAYLVIVDLGVLALSGFKNWRWFTLVAFLGSLLDFGVWYGGSGVGTEDLIAISGLSAIFLIFVGATLLFQFFRRKPFSDFDIILVIANGVLFYLFGMAILSCKLAEWTGAFSFGVAALYGILTLLAVSKEESLRVRPYLAGLGLAFLTMAIPLHFRGEYWTTVLWGVEGTALLALFHFRRVRLLDACGYAVLGLMNFWLALFAFREVAMVAWAAEGIAMLAVSVRLASFPFLVYSFVALALMNLWLAAFGDPLVATIAWALEGTAMVGASLRFYKMHLSAYGLVVLGLMNLWLAIHVVPPVATVLWAAEGAVMLWLWPLVRLPALRYYGYAIYGATLFWLAGYVAPAGFGKLTPVLNERFLVFAVAILALYLGAYLIYRRRRELSAEAEQLFFVYPIFLAIASLFTLAALSLEVLSYFQGLVNNLNNGEQFNTESLVLWNAASLVLSFIWVGYAIILLVIGIVRRSLTIRWAGLGLFGVVVIKLFAYDVFTLELVYRIVAFVGLGVVLLVSGYLYQRYASAIKCFLIEK